MPADFNMCVKNGGKIRTKTMGGGKYMHICILNGKSYAGDVKEKKGTEVAPKKEAFIRAANKMS